MAAVAAGAPLRFDIVADKTQFSRTVAEAKTEFDNASEEMQQSAGGIGTRFLETASKVGSSIGSLAQQMAAALDKGAAGVEQGLVAALDKVTEVTKATLENGLGSLGERWFGKIGERIGKALGNAISSNVEPATKSLLEKLADNGEFTAWLDNIVPKVQSLAKEFDGATSAAANLEKRFKSAVDGFKSFLDVKLGRALPIEEFEAIIAVLDKEIARRERVIELIGKTAAEQAKLRMTWQLEDAGANVEGMGEKQKERFAEKQAELEAAAAKEEGARKAEQQRHTFQSITVSMERQLQIAQSRNREGDKTLGQMTEEREIAQAISRMKLVGRDLSADELKIVKEKAAAAREAVDAANLENLVRQSANNARRAVRNSELDQGLVGATPGQIAEARAFANDLQRARETNLQLTPEIQAGFAANARSIGEAAQAAADARQKMDQLREAGQVVARSLESAFDKFISGTKVNFREMARGILEDMAKLIFRQQVLQPLFGGGGTPGAGVFGSLLTGNMFRADGGPVASNQPYIVGERGPELFFPRSAGSIIPNGAMGGGGPVNMTMTINLAGANGDETIARIASQAARQGAAMAVQQVNDGFPARQRSLQLLGA